MGRVPRNHHNNTLANIFVELANKDNKIVTDIIIAFIKRKKQEVLEGKISSQTVPNHIKPIKALLDSNGVLMPWKQIHKILPRRETVSRDRAYTKEELANMMKVASSLADRVIITMASSAGFREGAWDYFIWDDYVEFTNKDGSCKGGALRIYRGDPEEYWTHLTPEACKNLSLYKERFRADIGRYPKPDEPLLRVANNPRVIKLNSKGIKKRVQKIVTRIGLRPHLQPGVRRHEVQLMHGFRKYFHTMMRRAKVNYLDMEDMMGHKVGLEKHYERYLEEDFERFAEYQKAIPFLTISEEERLRYENEQKQKELEELEKNSPKLQELKRRLDKVEHGMDARKAFFMETRLAAKDKPFQYAIAVILQILFEMQAPEDEKKLLWKKIQEAKNSGKPIAEMLLEKDNFSWNNLVSSLSCQ